jgi:ribonucleoside-diphosphate reductase alpha chain
VVHSSNLCTEILLNTSETETAVCNLGSINLPAHVVDGVLDLPMLEETVRTAMRMLDNVVDINFYPTAEAKNSNQKHRPVGLGLMGFQDALAAMSISYASQQAVEFADYSMEAISYFAILASTELADERGTYSTYQGSKWQQGLLPIDTMDLLERERGCSIDVDRSARMDWSVVRAAVAKRGMRNSNCMAIAPTATISTIIGVSQSIEPMYKHLYVKSNLSGEFTHLNNSLVTELKSRGLWDADMLESLKYYDGVLTDIARIPADIKARYLTAFEVDPKWLIECAARRQKWIDMGQSLNLYMCEPSGRKLHDMYFLAWKKGLKTTYYLRTLAATQVEKSTVDVNKYGVQPRWMKNKSASSDIQLDRMDEERSRNDAAEVGVPAPHAVPATDMTNVKACSLDNPDCESCQ